MKLVGTGRCAQVFEHSPTTVLKLYNGQFDRAWVEASAQKAAELVAAGVPAPLVHGTESHQGRHGVVLEFIDGATMWELVGQQPKRATELGRQLAELHFQVHQCHVPDLPDRVDRLCQQIGQDPVQGIDEETRRTALRCLSDPPGEPAVLTHGDLHPGNVMVGVDGRVVAIDWDFPMSGPASAEVTRTHYLVLDWALAPGTNPSVAGVRDEMASSFFSACLDYEFVTEDAVNFWRLPHLVARLAAGIESERQLLVEEIDRVRN